MSKDTVKPGETTSEHKMARVGAIWGIVATFLGALTSIGAVAADALGADTKWGIIAGAIIAMGGMIQTTLVKLGYIKSRTNVKEAAESNK